MSSKSKLLADFGIPRSAPGQVAKHRMVQVYENQLFDRNVFKASVWDGEAALIKRGWAKFTNLAGDRLVPKAEYALTGSDAKPELKKSLSSKNASTVPPAAEGEVPNSPPPERGIQKRKSAINIAEEAAERRKALEEASGVDDQIERNVDETQDEEDDGEVVKSDEFAKYGDVGAELDEDERTSEIQYWNPTCPEGYEWVSAWKINRVHLDTDSSGWIYGNNIKHIVSMQQKLKSRATDSASYARRRVWYRVMAKIDTEPTVPRPFVLPLRMSCFFDSTESKECTFLMCIYENQRWSPILMSWGNKFPGHLLFHDPSALSNANYKFSVKDFKDLDALPAGFKWASDWTVDERPGITGMEGFLYASDFVNFFDNPDDGSVKLENSALVHVRRRRWTRRMVPQKEYIHKIPELDEMSVPALYPADGLVHPSQGKSVRRGLHHVDVIMVHGLIGSAAETFKGPIRLSQQDTLWADEYLFSDDKFHSVYGLPAAATVPLDHSVRTLVIEHGLFLDAEDPMWTMENAVNLLVPALRHALVGCRPIIWIGHSIGGLLIKELLYNSFKSDDNSIFALTRGIVFLATPHHGASSMDTILDMHIAKKNAVTEYLKPSMHFHEMQSWFDSTDIEYVNFVENKNASSKHFSGILANVLMKFVGLRIVQVNDGMLTMGAEPKPDLDTPVRYNSLVDLDHWGLGCMKLGIPAYDKMYEKIRLAVARWLRVKNDCSRTAWKLFSTSLSNELYLLSRLLYEIMKTNSSISRTLSAVSKKSNPDFVTDLLKKLTVGSKRQARLERLTVIKDVDADILDRLEDYLRERPLLETFIGKFRINMESLLCVLTESVADPNEVTEKMEDMVQSYTTRVFSLLCCVDIEKIEEAIVNIDLCKQYASDMVFWIELARCCSDILVPRDGCTIRDSEYSNDELDLCIEIVHGRLMEAIENMDESLYDSVETALSRPLQIVRASAAAIEGKNALTAPPMDAEAADMPPPVPVRAPQYKIGEEDDDLEIVTVVIPPAPILPPPTSTTSLDKDSILDDEVLLSANTNDVPDFTNFVLDEEENVDITRGEGDNSEDN